MFGRIKKRRLRKEDAFYHTKRIVLFGKMQVYAGIRREFQTDKITSVVVADRAIFGNRGATVDISAFQTHPCSFHIRYKKLVLLQQIGKETKAVPMCFFNLGNHIEGSGNAQKAFFRCNFCKSLVYIIMLLILVMLCKTKKLCSVLTDVNGIRAVNANILPA